MDHHGHNFLNWDNSSYSPAMQDTKQHWGRHSSPECCTAGYHLLGEDMSLTETPATTQQPPPPPQPSRRKRRRTKCSKNKEEMENQRMTHIVVERNRRKQMNEYLSIIRSLIPPSYGQRGDQASIIGGAINFVKELEQLVQTLEAKKRTTTQQLTNGSPPLFADIFTIPQYSTRSRSPTTGDGSPATADELGAENRPGFAEIDVRLAENHANLKILSNRRPRQLLKMVAGIQCLRLTVLHLNVTTVDTMVLYSLSVKIEDGCQLNTVDEIAGAVNHLLGRIEEDTAFSLLNAKFY